MNKQNLSSQAKFNTGIFQLVLALVFVFVSVGSVAQEAVIWRGNQAYDLLTGERVTDAETQASRARVSNAIEEFDQVVNPHHDPDCYEDKILEKYLTEVEIIGPDGRKKINRSQRPYVASIGGITKSGKDVVFGNGWMPHPQVVVTAAHLFSKDGKWHRTKSGEVPSRDQFNRYLIEVAGCDGRPIPVKEVKKIGTLDSDKEPGLDYAVLILERPSCLHSSEVADPVDLKDSLERDLLLPNGAQRMKVSAPAFIDPNTVGVDIGSGTDKFASGVVWPREQVDLLADSNYITGVKGIVHDGNDGKVRYVDKNYSGPEEVFFVYATDVDMDQGTSGAPLVMDGDVVINNRRMNIERIPGMVVYEDDSAIESNYGLVYTGRFKEDVESVVKSMTSGTSI